MEADSENAGNTRRRLGPPRRVVKPEPSSTSAPPEITSDALVEASPGRPFVEGGIAVSTAERALRERSKSAGDSGGKMSCRSTKSQSLGGVRHNPIARQVPSYLRPTAASATKKEVVPPGSRRAPPPSATGDAPLVQGTSSGTPSAGISCADSDVFAPPSASAEASTESNAGRMVAQGDAAASKAGPVRATSADSPRAEPPSTRLRVANGLSPNPASMRTPSGTVSTRSEEERAHSVRGFEGAEAATAASFAHTAAQSAAAFAAVAAAAVSSLPSSTRSSRSSSRVHIPLPPPPAPTSAKLAPTSMTLDAPSSAAGSARISDSPLIAGIGSLPTDTPHSASQLVDMMLLDVAHDHSASRAPLSRSSTHPKPPAAEGDPHPPLIDLSASPMLPYAAPATSVPAQSAEHDLIRFDRAPSSRGSSSRSVSNSAASNAMASAAMAEETFAQLFGSSHPDAALPRSSPKRSPNKRSSGTDDMTALGVASPAAVVSMAGSEASCSSATKRARRAHSSPSIHATADCGTSDGPVATAEVNASLMRSSWLGPHAAATSQLDERPHVPLASSPRRSPRLQSPRLPSPQLHRTAPPSAPPIDRFVSFSPIDAHKSDLPPVLPSAPSSAAPSATPEAALGMSGSIAGATGARLAESELTVAAERAVLTAASDLNVGAASGAGSGVAPVPALDLTAAMTAIPTGNKLARSPVAQPAKPLAPLQPAIDHSRQAERINAPERVPSAASSRPGAAAASSTRPRAMGSALRPRATGGVPPTLSSAAHAHANGGGSSSRHKDSSAPSSSRSGAPTGGAPGPSSGSSTSRTSSSSVRPADVLGSVRVSDGAKGLLAALSETCVLLKSREESGEEHEEWTKRRDCMQAIPAILTAAAELADGSLEAFLEAIVKPIVSQLADLRSSIVRVACKLLDDLVKEHGRAASALAAGVMPQVLKNLYVSVKAISSASNETALNLVKGAPSSAVVSVLFAFSSDPHHQTRRGCAECLACVIRGGFSPTDKQLADLSKALKALTADADPKVREAAAKCFWLMYTSWAGHAEALQAIFDPAQKKLVARHKPKV